MKKRRRYQEREKYFIGRCIAILIICIGLFIVAINMENMQQAKESEKEVRQAAGLAIEVKKEELEISDTNMLKEVDFDALWQINADIYAYIEIPDTQISYPVLQSNTQEEDYYLSTNIDGSSGYPGSIYSQKINKKDFTDCNTILYGHNMRDGSMFAELHKYEDRAFFEAHPYVYIYLPNEALKYQIIAGVVYSDANISDTYNLTDQNGTNQFIQQIVNEQRRSKQIIDGVELGNQEKLLTLSTCIGGQSDHRWLVVGRLIDQLNR